MATKTNLSITRHDLREAAYRAVSHITREQARKIVDEFFDEIIKAFEQNESIKLRGFGHFKLQHKKQRIGRNPKTRVEAVITPRRVVKFAASRQLVAKLNGETYVGEDDD